MSCPVITSLGVMRYPIFSLRLGVPRAEVYYSLVNPCWSIPMIDPGLLSIWKRNEKIFTGKNVADCQCIPGLEQMTQSMKPRPFHVNYVVRPKRVTETSVMLFHNPPTYSRLMFQTVNDSETIINVHDNKCLLLMSSTSYKSSHSSTMSRKSNRSRNTQR